MRLAKLSLAAIVALGVSAFADVENVKFGGDAKLYYATQDAKNQQLGVRPASGDLFAKENSAGQAALDLWATAEVGDGAKAKIAVTMLNTLGLENNLVSNVWEGGLDNQWWVSEAWLAKSFGNTTVKVGRQELDTPMAFSEKWSIAENTFDAAVVVNTDLPQTTLVGAWIGRGNNAGGVGTTNDLFPLSFGGNQPHLGYAPIYGNVVNYAGNGVDSFQTFGDSGAYAIAAITKLIPNTTTQVWYYNVNNITTAWWVQADVTLDQVVQGLNAGIQFNNIDPDEGDGDSAWAVKLGYTMENLKANIAYSSVGEDGYAGNTAGKKSKLYTEAWWNYGYVAVGDSDAWHVDVEYDMPEIADFGAYYTNVSNDEADVDMTEFTLTASKSFGSLDATLAYIYTDADDQNEDNNGKADSYNTIQVYLTYNF